jgi:ABC-type siderophore export system fused ATPase/permease subunit
MDPVSGGGIVGSVIGAFTSIINGAQNVKVAQAQAQAAGYQASAAMTNSFIQSKVGQQNIVLYSVIGVVSFSVLLMVFKMRK